MEGCPHCNIVLYGQMMDWYWVGHRCVCHGLWFSSSHWFSTCRNYLPTQHASLGDHLRGKEPKRNEWEASTEWGCLGTGGLPRMWTSLCCPSHCHCPGDPNASNCLFLPVSQVFILRLHCPVFIEKRKCLGCCVVGFSPLSCLCLSAQTQRDEEKKL